MRGYSGVMMHKCEVYYVMGLLTLATFCSVVYGQRASPTDEDVAVETCLGDPLAQDSSPSLERNWHKEELNELSGDGEFEESKGSSLKLQVKTTVPLIRSSFSTHLQYSSSSIIHSSFPETSQSTSEAQSPFSIDYSIEVTTDMENCEMSHPSLPYSGPSSLLNTFIFRPSMGIPQPTPQWSSTVIFTTTSGLRERSWWEVDEIPFTSHESHLSSPTPSLPVGEEATSSSSCDSSTFVTTEVLIDFVTSPLISPTPSSAFTPDVITVSDGSSLLPETSSYSVVFVSSIDISTSETIKTTNVSSVRSTRLPVFVTDQLITTGFTSSAGSSNNIQSTYHPLSTSSALITASSESDLIAFSDSFNTSTMPTMEFSDGSSLRTDLLPSTVLFTRTSEYGDNTPIWMTGRSFVDTSITASQTEYESTGVFTYYSITSSDYQQVTSYATLQDVYTMSYSSTAGTTTESSIKTTKSPSTESATLEDVKYWVKTVVKVDPGILPISFLSTVRSRLAGIYGLAFRRRELSSRQKRQVDSVSIVKVQFTKYSVDWQNHQVELVYTVEYYGQPVVAESAVEVLEEVDRKEFAEMMGYIIIIKAEVYLKKALVQEKEKSWVVYAVIGIVGGILLFIICVIALYFRYCHVKEERLDTESVRLKMFGQKNMQQAFQEETQRSQQEVKNVKDVDRPLPQLPFPVLKKPKERMGKTGSEKGPLVSTETQTEGCYNAAYESDTTEASLTSVTSTTQTSSQEESLKSPYISSKIEKSPLKISSKPKWPSAQVLTKSATNDRHKPAQFESAKTSLLARRKGQTIGTALSDTDAGTAEAEIEVGRMRRRITELLDDAFSYAGPKRMYSSLRTRPILPTSGSFHRWTSLRSPNHQKLLDDTFIEAKSAESLPDVDPMKARHQPLIIDLPPHKQPPAKPRVVWSIYKAGDEVSEISHELQEQAKATEQEASENKRASPTKLFEHYAVPPPSAFLQPRPASPSSLIHPSFRPFSAPTVVSPRDSLRPPYAVDARSGSQQPTTSSVPLLDTLQESQHPLHHHPSRHYHKDEVDTATELKFRQPAQSVIEAIRDELRKFNTSLPSDNRESYA